MNNSRVVDVGCDHGLLSIYIYLNKKNVSVIASDINEKPLKEAKKNISEYKLAQKIETRISDGLKNINSDEFDTIVISGLGGNTIVQILCDDKEKLKNAKYIIIQANNNIDKVRSFLANNGYVIKDEKIIKENDIISIVIKFEKINKKVNYNKRELLYGPVLIEKMDKLFIELLNNDLVKYKNILNNIPSKYIFKRCRINKNIKIINKILEK